MIQIDMPLPKCCGTCFALDDTGDYPLCLISKEQRGYTFNVNECRMPHCPLKEMIEQEPGRAQWYGLYGRFLWTDDEKEREKLKEQTLDELGQELVRQKNLVRICYLDEPMPINGVMFGSIGVKLKAEPLEEAEQK